MNGFPAQKAAVLEDKAAMLEDFVTLWIGDSLSFLERACLRSVVRHGHRVALYRYDRLEGVPEGVELRDAAEILPASSIVRHVRTGSPSLFSNRFRYELLRRNLGTWIDCDVYFVRPLPRGGEYLFASQGGQTLNTAILRLPSDSPVLRELLAIFDEQSVPPWLPLRARVAATLRLAVRGQSGLAEMPWGSAGPEALTWLARVHGIEQHAVPSSRFYPVPWTQAHWLTDPLRPIESVIGPDTIAVHLWKERLSDIDLAAPPASSFAARLCAEGAMDAIEGTTATGEADSEASTGSLHCSGFVQPAH